MRYTLAALAIALLGSLPTRADVILSTDFNGGSVSGSTLSGITWVTNGVANPGALTAMDNPNGLFTTTPAQEKFAPKRNLHNEGSWYVDILLALLGADIALSSVSLDAYIFNNQGELQTVNRNLSMSATLLDDTLTALQPPAIAANIFPNNGPAISQPASVNFNFGGNTLTAGNTYTLRLTAFGEGPGNNAGFDNLVVNGDFAVNEVPEPAPLTLMVLGMLAVTAAKRRRRPLA